jgi:hypothetical protein
MKYKELTHFNTVISFLWRGETGKALAAEFASISTAYYWSHFGVAHFAHQGAIVQCVLRNTYSSSLRWQSVTMR